MTETKRNVLHCDVCGREYSKRDMKYMLKLKMILWDTWSCGNKHHERFEKNFSFICSECTEKMWDVMRLDPGYIKEEDDANS